MDYKKQVNRLRIETITKPRVFLKWENTEKGRDKKECYERVDEPYIYYINQFDKSMTVDISDVFFKTLEDMYKTVLSEA